MIIKSKSFTNGLRNKIYIKNFLKKNRYFKNFIKISKRSGRNNSGKITVRHKGGGIKINYRNVDFKRNNFNVIGKIIKIDYDPNRNVNIALVLYDNFIKNYIILPRFLKENDTLISSCDKLPLKIGNNMPIGFIPIGTRIHCLESNISNYAKYIRSAGCYAIIISKLNGFVNIVLKSGEIKKFNFFCRATVGEISNEEFFLKKIGKAGINRLKNIRPTVRGVAMNPVDHPHGGGEGKSSGGRDPVSSWGKPTKGFKTKKKNIKIIKYKY